MKLLLIVGVVLVAIGLAGLLWGGFSYTKSRDTADLGLFEFTVEEKEHLAIHPAVGAVVLVAGAVIVFASLRRR
jgi:TRAP-type C4-dicarboxylate transport system permease small subunit